MIEPLPHPDAIDFDPASPRRWQLADEVRITFRPDGDAIDVEPVSGAPERLADRLLMFAELIASHPHVAEALSHGARIRSRQAA